MLNCHSDQALASGVSAPGAIPERRGQQINWYVDELTEMTATVFSYKLRRNSIPAGEAGIAAGFSSRPDTESETIEPSLRLAAAPLSMQDLKAVAGNRC